MNDDMKPFSDTEYSTSALVLEYSLHTETDVSICCESSTVPYEWRTPDLTLHNMRVHKFILQMHWGQLHLQLTFTPSTPSFTNK